MHPAAERQAIFKRALRCFPIALQGRDLAQYAINGHTIVHEAVQFLNALTIGSSLLINPQVEETFSEHGNIEMTAIPHRLGQYSRLFKLGLRRFSTACYSEKMAIQRHGAWIPFCVFSCNEI